MLMSFERRVQVGHIVGNGGAAMWKEIMELLADTIYLLAFQKPPGREAVLHRKEGKGKR